MLISSIELVLAVLFEFVSSEPPNAIHPTVWFGKIIDFLDKKLPPTILSGSIPVIATVSFAVLLSFLPRFIPFPFNVFLSGYLLYSTFSVRSMIEHARNCISGGTIIRENVQMIVSRNTKGLSEAQLCSAVIESVSENFVDGVIAPLFYYILFGLAGAMAYRAVNTCDAMLGYRKGRYERFGKVSARIDDLLNFIPSRLSLLFYALFSFRALIYGIKMNPKLNGNSISAMACLLGVTLEKPGEYKIDCGRDAEIRDVLESIRFFKVFSAIAVIATVLLKLMV